MLVLPPELATSLGDQPFDTLMSYPGEVFRKQPHRETLRIQIQDQSYFIKRHRGISLKECFKNWFSGRLPVLGAQPEWKAIQALTQMGIATTPLVGYGQRGYWPLTQESFVLTQELKSCQSLEDLARTQGLSLREKRSWLMRVAHLVRQLHDQNWVHRDLYLCHFFIDPQQQIHLIDLHRMIQPRFFKQRWRVKDLAALLFSSLDLGLTRHDALFFWKEYRGLPLKECLTQDQALLIAVRERAKGQYLKAHRTSPAQTWMHPGEARLPLSLGPYYESFDFDKGVFVSSQTLRILPRRRWVIKGDWQGQKVVLKLFADRRSYLKELAGTQALQQAKILSPELLYQGRFKKLYALIFDYIENAAPALELTPALINTMMNLHKAGLIQQDCHRDNFLQREGRIYVLDPGGIKIQAQVTQEQALNNLALLFAQWPLSEDAKHLLLISHTLLPAQSHFLERVWTLRTRRRDTWLKKIFRNCTPIKVKSRFTLRYCANRDFDTLYTQTLFNYPDAYFHDKADYLKRGNSATVVRTQLGPHDLVIKRFNRKNWIKRLKRYFTQSKAARAWRMSHAMESIGIATPKPLAMIEKRFGPICLDSYFITEYTPGERLDHLKDLVGCSEALNTLMDNLDSALCAHGDLKASNLLWDGKTLYLLDTDGAKFYKTRRAFESAHAADWERLLRNFTGGSYV